MGLGEFGHVTALAADSFSAGNGEILYGVQAHRYDGPWTDVNEDVNRNNVLLRYSAGDDDSALQRRVHGLRGGLEFAGPDPAPRGRERV